MRNLDGVSPLINVVLSQKGRLFSSQGTVIQHQNECLVSQRHGGKYIQEEIGKLALTGNPRSRWGIADQSSFLPTHALGDRVEEIMALSDPNTPIVEESNGAHVTADREHHSTLLRLEYSGPTDRKSTRLNSSHTVISYAVFCLKK